MRRLARGVAAAALWISLASPARADDEYRWRAGAASADTVAARIAPPPGATRVEVGPASFGAWLRGLPLRERGAAVHLFDGSVKPRQDVHAEVVDLDVGTRDLQQCADAVMRLRAEYLRARGRRVAFHPDPGKPRELAWTPPARETAETAAAWRKYLVRVFADAGTASLAAELARVPSPATALAPGDVLIQGGYPGHAVLVLDAAVAPDGRRWVLLGQSYMPAQEFHVLKNLEDPARSPWFDAAALAAPGGLQTPEWRPFVAADARRFRD